MRRFALLASFCFASFSCSRKPEFPYQDAGLSVDRRVLDLMQRITHEEKLEVLRGRPVPRLGIPALRVPTNEPTSGVALAATWDSRIVAQVAGAQPSAFSYYGEDPWLASRMAVAWTSGMQSAGRIAVMRDFPCAGSPQTLNERAFPPFRAAIEEAGLWAVGAGGCAEDVEWITNILDREWGFRGFILGPGEVVLVGANPDDTVRRILRPMFAEGWFDPPAKTTPVDRKRIDRIAAEESIVLLKNDSGLLPIYASRLRSIGVSGSKAQADAIRARSGSTPVVEGADASAKADVAIVFKGTRIEIASPPLAKTGALLESWNSTAESAQGATDVIFGDVNPSGKLPVTEAPFPFGFGLSYTTFDWSELRIFPATPRYGQLVQVVVKVRNTGAREGAEVVEVYLHQVKSSLERRAKELKAFQRVELKPGESRDVAMTLDSKSMSFWDPLVKDWAAEPGLFEVMLGTSSEDIRLKGSFQLFQ